MDGPDDIKEEMRPRVALSWKGLSVWSEQRQPWYRGGGPARRTYILNNVKGEITEGSFVAVIGPSLRKPSNKLEVRACRASLIWIPICNNSGAGKTTLLACLAGKCRLPHSGLVAVAAPAARAQPAGCAVDLTPQHDVHLRTLTVAEHLCFMAEMRLSGKSSSHHHSKMCRVNLIVKQLRLQACMDTPIRALSGGETKLLSLATSMLSEPKIILCDEPTSGLDSYSAALVVAVLKDLAATGSVVVCSIHQPSSHVFHQFNGVILLADSRLLFHGTLDDCRKLFESVELKCPKTYNPAEFYINQVSHHEGKVLENCVEKLHKTFNDVTSENNAEDGSVLTAINETNMSHSSRPNWFRQVALLVWRSSLSVKREIPMHLVQLFLHLVSAMIIGAVYGGLAGEGQRGVQNMRGLLWLITSEVSFGITYASLAAFGFDLTLYKREVDLYSGSAYYVASFICMLPRCAIWPFLFLLISTSGISLPAYLSTIGELTATLTILALTSAAYGVGMAALFTTTGIIVDIIPCVDLILFLVSGTFIRLSSMPAWSQSLRYLSHFYYGLEAVSNIYWEQIDNIHCAANATSSSICLRDGTQVLAEDGYGSDFILQDSLGLLSLALGWCLVGYWGLRREGKKGYAY